MSHAYIGFGSNIDDRFNYITQALRLLLEADDVSLIQISSLYETEPVGYEEQDWFLNGVVAVETGLSVHQLLALLKGIEQLVGRQHRARWGPREVDLDLLIYDQCCIDTPNLTVPHPEMHQRSFVLVPFAEIAPDVRHPILQENIQSLLANLTDEKTVKLAAPPPEIVPKGSDQMPYNPQNPLIVQSDRTILLEVDTPLYEAARDALASFAELEKSPEHIHTYRITPLSLWNAAAAGIAVGDILGALDKYTKYDVPQNIIAEIIDYVARYGRVKLMKHADLNPDSAEDDGLVLHAEDPVLMAEIAHSESVKSLLGKRIDAQTISVPYQLRGHIKQALIKIGFPVEDLAGYVTGSYLEIAPRSMTQSGNAFSLRGYQRDAAEVFHLGGDVRGGSGVIVLPCGAGKTVVGLGILFETKCHTLILSTNTIAVRQWIDEFLDKTTIRREDIGEYTGDRKEIRPITVTTYQILTYRRRKSEDFVHLGLFSEMDWGLIIYDEVHLLPAPVFRMTAEIQGKRRLGLTATLVREDGREDDVFSLIGPKKYDVPWRELEQQGWIATAECVEIRVDLPEHLRMSYAVASARQKFRIASENPNKFPVVCELLERHKGDLVLIIGQYIDQLKGIAASLNAPLIMGQTPNLERGKLYDRFRRGEIKLLVVSKVANFAIDLPDANVAIQVSGTFGSRQEEAQRLGRILRPKTDGSLAHFYSLVTRDSRDQEFAINRQLFLTEQGYRYTIRYGHEYNP